MQIENMPSFDLQSYERLLNGFRNNSYKFRLVSEIRHEYGGRVVYLRHDIDLHLQGIERMPEIEAKNGIQATYYVPLTAHFNPLYPENRRVLRRIQDLGHEIGLHYDMTTYPTEEVEAKKHLDWEVNILSRITGKPVRTISMHQPHTGQPDPFRELDKYIHPHDPRYQNNLLYISDSCRAWRDESLLTCFSPNPPLRLLLLIHPELWLNGKVKDRMKYLNQVLMKNGLHQHRNYFDSVLRQIWMTHPAPKLHDKRNKLGFS
jgi:hypothetical protein